MSAPPTLKKVAFFATFVSTPAQSNFWSCPPSSFGCHLISCWMCRQQKKTSLSLSLSLSLWKHPCCFYLSLSLSPPSAECIKVGVSNRKEKREREGGGGGQVSSIKKKSGREREGGKKSGDFASKRERYFFFVSTLVSCPTRQPSRHISLPVFFFGLVRLLVQPKHINLFLTAVSGTTLLFLFSFSQHKWQSRV